jgi:hypothetical protein
MMKDLPEINDLFNNDKKDSEDDSKNLTIGGDSINENEIIIYISSNKSKWISCIFIDFAPSRIGMHLMLPVAIDFEANDLDNIHLKFEKKQRNTNVLLKEMTVLLRWHEKDPVTGRMKIGLHFHGEDKNDTLLMEILDKIKQKRKYISENNP